MRKKRVYDMCEGPLVGQMIFYTIPIILSSVLQLLFNAADLVVVGQFCGSNSVAAVGATGALTNLLVNFFIGLSVGVGVVVANNIGARDRLKVQEAVHTAIPMALIGGAFLTLLGIFFSETFLIWMGTPKEILSLSTLYMRIYFGGMIFNLVYNFGAAILRASGDTAGPLKYLTLAGILNVGLNLFFVLVLHMNVAGVALATIIAQGLSAALVLLALIKRRDFCRLNLKKMRFHKDALRGIFTVGLPAGIQSSLFAISNVLIQSSINIFGNVVMAGNAAASNIEGFVYASMHSWQQTVMNYIAQNAGAKRYDRVRRVFWICIAGVTIVGICLGALSYLFGTQLLSIYLSDSQSAVQYGLARLGIVGLLYFICGLMDVISGAIRGMGVSFTPMIVSLLGACGLRILWIVTIFQIPEFHTTTGLYYSYPISWAITALAHFITFRLVYKKRLKESETEKALKEESAG